jgi:hypothetical protein
VGHLAVALQSQLWPPSEVQGTVTLQAAMATVAEDAHDIDACHGSSEGFYG